MALQWQVINIQPEGYDVTRPVMDQGTRTNVNGRFLRASEISPSDSWEESSFWASNTQGNWLERIYYVDNNLLGLRRDRALQALTYLPTSRILLASHRAEPVENVAGLIGSAFGADCDTTNGVHFGAYYQSGSPNTITCVAIPYPSYSVSDSILNDLTYAPTNYSNFDYTLATQFEDNIRIGVMKSTKTLYLFHYSPPGSRIVVQRATYTIDSANNKIVQFNSDTMTFVQSIVSGHSSSNAEATFDMDFWRTASTDNETFFLAITTVANLKLIAYNSTGIVDTENMSTAFTATNTRVTVFYNQWSTYIHVFWTALDAGNNEIWGAVYTYDGAAFTQVTAPSLVYSIASGDLVVGMTCCWGYEDLTKTGFMVCIKDVNTGLDTHTMIYCEFDDFLDTGGFTDVGYNTILTSKAFYSTQTNASGESPRAYFYGYEAEPSVMANSHEAIYGLGDDGFGNLYLVRVASLGGGRTGSYAISQCSIPYLGRILRLSDMVAQNTEIQAAAGLTSQPLFPTTSSVMLRFCEIAHHASGLLTTYVNRSYVTAGNLYEYIGNELVDTGFWRYPIQVDVTETPFVGGIPATTVLNYKLVWYSEIDGKRDVFGPPSENLTYTVTATPGDYAVEIQVQTPPRNHLRSTKVLVFTRDSGSGNYYYQANADIDYTGPTTTVTLTTTITTTSQLYTDFAEVPNVAPFSAKCTSTALGRVVTVDDFGTVLVTKPYNFTRSLEFSDLIFAPAIPDGLKVVATGNLDQTLVAFTDNAIYGIAGSAPDSFGNGTFSLWQKIQNDTVCSSQQTVITFAEGLFFSSTRGLLTVDRGLSVSPAIGAKISSIPTNQVAAPSPRVLTGGCFDGRNSEIKFIEATRIWTYNLNFAQWTAEDLQFTATAIAASPSAPTVTVGPAAGIFFAKTPSIAQAPGVYQRSFTYTTGWIPLFGGQQYGRVRRISILFGRNSPTPDAVTRFVRVTINYDYRGGEGYSSETFQLATTPDTSTDGQGWAIRLRADVQKIRAINVTISCTPFYEIVFRGISIEASPKVGVQKLRAAQTG